MNGNNPELEPTAPWNEEFMDLMREIATNLHRIAEVLEERM
tara:strand:+ start:85 stop:207 length:123 start_codon:yes stop_codon:yes gene_type:complete